MPRLRSPILQHALTPHMLPAAPYLAYSCTACPRAVPPHVQSLLRRLLDRLCRPQPCSRLGAALALRRCAPRLRNQEAAASAYGLELMRELLVALKAADGKCGECWARPRIAIIAGQSLQGLLHPRVSYWQDCAFRAPLAICARGLDPAAASPFTLIPVPLFPQRTRPAWARLGRLRRQSTACTLMLS